MTSSPASLPAPEESVDRAEALVQSLMHRMLRLRDLQLDTLGLSHAQFRVLSHLASAGPINVGEVGRLLGIARSSATEMVARMERDGLVVKSRPRPHAREIQIAPTPKARKLVRRASLDHRSAFGKLLARLDPAETGDLLRALETLSRLLEKAMP